MVLRDNIFGTPEEDALCRDFTINALAYNIADFSVIDYSTGLSDLQQRLIRPIGDPYVRFTEDPVRMLRAVRFSASHNLFIESATWEALCELSSIITRVPPARLYEEMQKLFLLGSARSCFSLMEKSGLLAALFPDLSQWMYGSSHCLRLLQTNLEYLDQLYLSGKPPSPTLFLAALFGPGIEEAVLASHRDGIPYQQALENICAVFIEEVCKPASIPGRFGNQLRAILALQHSLHKTPPKRPFSTVSRPEFADAMAYLRITAETKKENRTSLEWWEAFLLKTPSITCQETSPNEAPVKKRKKRRRKHRHTPTGTPPD
jgi:poly(A) polymerase